MRENTKTKPIYLNTKELWETGASCHRGYISGFNNKMCFL